MMVPYAQMHRRGDCLCKKNFMFAEEAEHHRCILGSMYHECVPVWLQDELFAPLQCQPNFPASRKEVSMDLKTLLQ